MKMTPEKMERAQALREQGKTYREIGAVIGMDGGSVRYNLDKDARAAILERNAGCREEKAAYDLEYNAANKEGRADYVKKHKARIEIRDKAYRDNHRAEIAIRNAAYKETHTEELSLYHADYRAERREENIAYQKTYREGNKDVLTAKRKIYHDNHKPEDLARNAKRRALKAGALVGATIAQLAEIKEIYRKAKEEPKVRCYLCGDLIKMGERQVDHIMPLSKGGSHRPSNLAVACASCNMQKHNKLPEEAGILL